MSKKYFVIFHISFPGQYFTIFKAYIAHQAIFKKNIPRCREYFR